MRVVDANPLIRLEAVRLDIDGRFVLPLGELRALGVTGLGLCVQRVTGVWRTRRLALRERGGVGGTSNEALAVLAPDECGAARFRLERMPAAEVLVIELEGESEEGVVSIGVTLED